MYIRSNLAVFVSWWLAFSFFPKNDETKNYANAAMPHQKSIFPGIHSSIKPESFLSLLIASPTFSLGGDLENTYMNLKPWRKIESEEEELNCVER